MRLLGAGAALSLAPASLSSLAARPSFAQTPGPEILSEQGEYPIGVWTPPPPAETTAARYAEIAGAGFNFVIGGNGATGNDDHPLTLAAAQAAGLAFLLTDNTLTNAIMGEVSPDRQEAVTRRLERLLGDYGAHPALAGLNLYDEPNSRLFGILAYARAELERLAPQELPFVNLNPSYASRGRLGTRTYAQYLNRYVGGVQPPLLSFDHYPLLTRGRLTSDHFYNWAAIRSRALAADIPSWTFIQSVDFRGTLIGPPRRRPNEAELFWQANVGLAYGAKGIVYFTYWTPEDDRYVQFGEALVRRDGTLSDTYDAAKEVNEEYLRKVGKQLLPLTSESVTHAGVRRARPGVRPFKADGWLRAASGSLVILGKFHRTSDDLEYDPELDPVRYLFVVNRSLAAPSSTRLTVSDSVVEVSRFDTTTDAGAYVPEPLGTSTRSFRVDLGAGRAALYRLSRTAN